MKFEVQSIDYNTGKKKMTEYKIALERAGVNVIKFVSPEYDNYLYSQIIIDIETANDFVKVVDAVGEIIFNGYTIKIYDGYYE